MRSYRHTDFFLPGAPEHLFFPKVESIDDDSVIVGDWKGRLRRIDLKSMSETASTNFNLLRFPRSVHQICVDPSERTLCAISTRTAACRVGRVGDVEFRDLSGDGDGPVNCGAYSSDGKYLALGRGYYALHSGNVSSAYVEIWENGRDGTSWWKEETIMVPGICVDLIAWPSAGPEFICVTGLRNQSGGFLIPFDKNRAPAAYHEIAVHIAKGLVYEYPWAIVLDSNSLVAYSIHTGGVRWSMPASGAIAMTHDPTRDEVILTTGIVVSSEDGSVVGKMDPLDKCTSVALISGGKVVGVSESGAVRVWEETNM